MCVREGCFWLEYISHEVCVKEGERERERERAKNVVVVVDVDLLSK